MYSDLSSNMRLVCLHRSPVTYQARAYPTFCGIKQLKIFERLLPGRDASQSQGYPSIYLLVPIYSQLSSCGHPAITDKIQISIYRGLT